MGRGGINVHKEEHTSHHLHLNHPAAKRITQLVIRAKGDKYDSEVGKFIKQIKEACKTFQEYRSAPLRFKVSMPNDEIDFN